MTSAVATPHVTVLLCVFNGGGFLHAAIDSILQQTFTDFEFIILDDASTDNTPDILASWAKRDQRIVLMRNEVNLGLTRSLNKGVRMARGKWIARQDSDDISLPQRLEKQVNFLNNHPQVGLLGTLAWGMDEQGALEFTPRLVPYNHTQIGWYLLFGNAFFHASVVFSREMVLANPYDETLRFGQDFELWGRLLTQTKGANLAEPLVCLRYHSRRISVVHAQAQQAIGQDIVLQRHQRLVPGFSCSLQELRLLRGVAVSSWPIPGETLSACRWLLRLFQAFAKCGDLDPEQVIGLRDQLLMRLWNSIFHALSVGEGWVLVKEMGQYELGVTWQLFGRTLQSRVVEWLRRIGKPQ